MRSTSVAIVTSRDRFELGNHTAACRACAFRTNGGFHDATPRGRHHDTPRLEQLPSEFITRLDDVQRHVPPDSHAGPGQAASCQDLHAHVEGVVRVLPFLEQRPRGYTPESRATAMPS